MTIHRNQIYELLEEAKRKIESEVLKITSGENFENHVFKTLEQIARKKGIINVKQTGKQSFPDIIIDNFGVEVKFSASNKWDSTGNSIFEGTYQSEVTEEIYVFFGKAIGEDKLEIRYDLYENCLSDVKVTHSPRFFINMDQDPKDSIFNQLGLKYSDYRKLSDINKSKLIKQYLKSKLVEGEKVWWIDDETTPVAKEFRNLSVDKKRRINAELFTLFPELFSNSNSKYIGASIYLLTEYQLVNSSLRDTFTASGRVDFSIEGKLVNRIPQIYKKLFESAKDIKTFLDAINIDTLKEYWMEHSIVNESQIISDRHSTWKMLINYYGINLPEGIRPSVFYEGGLGMKNVKLKS